MPRKEKVFGWFQPKKRAAMRKSFFVYTIYGVKRKKNSYIQECQKNCFFQKALQFIRYWAIIVVVPSEREKNHNILWFFLKAETIQKYIHPYFCFDRDDFRKTDCMGNEYRKNVSNQKQQNREG